MKRLEYDRLTGQKELEKALALARVSTENLERKLRDRDLALAALQESSRLELGEARARLKAARDELEARLAREQEEWLRKHEAQRVKYDALARELREELAASQTVSCAAAPPHPQSPHAHSPPSPPLGRLLSVVGSLDGRVSVLSGACIRYERRHRQELSSSRGMRSRQSAHRHTEQILARLARVQFVPG